jgi:molecular chaperone GrpE
MDLSMSTNDESVKNEHEELVELPPENQNEAEAEESQPDMAKLFEQVESELKVLQDRYLRLGAEFENYKKRADKDRQTAVRFASEGLLHELLPVLDHLEQAVIAAEHGGKNVELASTYETVVTGIKMVLKQFQDTLGRFGVQCFSAANLPFDPTKHEAVAEREDADAPEGQVLAEFQKGYMLHERLIRPARVVVAKRPKVPQADA